MSVLHINEVNVLKSEGKTFVLGDQESFSLNKKKKGRKKRSSSIKSESDRVEFVILVVNKLTDESFFIYFMAEQNMGF